MQKTEAPATVRISATTFERLLIAPSVLPNSIAFAVPIAWDAVPSASLLRCSLNTLFIIYKIFPALGIGMQKYVCLFYNEDKMKFILKTLSNKYGCVIFAICFYKMKR